MFPALLLSYLVSVLFDQIMDITVFNRLRLYAAWWVAPACSTVAGNLIDTPSFFRLAFAGSADPFMAIHWMEIAMVDYGYKVGRCAATF